ncbi:hypothetical protein [Couchioplanes caeruleus]|uniref:Uncharacterized protein n=2 Tax=Couchioplanes caeruleus TaxID=56438 RepID=A0A1K0FRU5_9ACTN|nr:hypothetical protein [Couchioplanes caeruleus]OJF15416.1 hypothetical protein BG844_04770 [Couchioplanes caeruleus subsp. caeruleus]ROP33459.1 hypothetical protein EDD30_6443 [Couchioplanes caeruleus]
MINTGGVINPGTQPVENPSEELAVAALEVFLTEVRKRAAYLEATPLKRRVAGLTGDPVRDPAADRDGRYGWDLPLSDGRVVRLLMPGVRVELLRDDISARLPVRLGDCMVVGHGGGHGRRRGPGPGPHAALPALGPGVDQTTRL